MFDVHTLTLFYVWTGPHASLQLIIYNAMTFSEEIDAVRTYHFIITFNLRILQLAHIYWVDIVMRRKYPIVEGPWYQSATSR
ncbi:hypothetical protein SERLA73DRAFT_189384 [Serpula lacrymans var. lacrymans S7.3]|uniref:Uncharacterized protein n=2 Tax=Serpula lacrymans var. lacrymans TaxID=341189 RepID=F8QDH7_SERL3|nr:uncharacterized protein SERLADRAFT_480173 [Serpula lacrymans var. lacrymans S7.9]EGN93648.1 hypothetical protein SERLA73DRAFT_189384 [Serpula lacrymans var. lacrymans S7.3]EGO19025.1 hypothetical protein SERLADRAFT_480173 [Serpula lacrymans var. lacrymans S7.9]